MNGINELEFYILLKTPRNKYRADLPKWAILEKLYNCEIKNNCKK